MRHVVLFLFLTLSSTALSACGPHPGGEPVSAAGAGPALVAEAAPAAETELEEPSPTGVITRMAEEGHAQFAAFCETDTDCPSGGRCEMVDTYDANGEPVTEGICQAPDAEE